ncbi:putative actin-binding protein [Phaeomoniella chlamydospora]|uniref:Coronin n=1 Tax=Phaeomoniella chlamydospora TaxID=158046 RepID=A0A0G2GAY1_PHACM|nr:putative actin-binding protein [Phaeomoniella chlamydospora]
MSGRFVRSSKYRHVFGRPTRKDQCYDNLRVSKNAWDTNLVKANPEYLAVNWDAGGGGAFAVVPLNERGRLPDLIPLFRGHTATVLDTDWNPFNDALIASGGYDGKILLWRVPDEFTLKVENPEDIKDVNPVGKLSGHPKQVGHVLFNPAAENVVASASGDFTIKLWDIEAGSSKLTLKVGDVVQSLTWNPSGSLLVTTSRDKKLRLWDVRQERPAQEVNGHAGAKNSRAVWLGEHDRVATTGFSKMSDRQLALWDIKAPNQPIGGFERLDSISGVCMPFWDDGTQCLYLAGKGDGNIRYYEYENDKFQYLSEYKSADPQRGIAFMPKRGVNMHENEVMRAYKTVNDNYIEPISFIVPRRAESFQEDIYPPTVGLKPAMSSGEWFDGKEAMPPKVDMASIYEGKGLKEVPGDSKPATKAPEPIKTQAAPKKPEVEEAKAPTPTTTRAPPPSMKEQGSSMAAMVDKFTDNDADKGEESDASSFEEVAKPAEKKEEAKPFAPPPTKTVEQPAKPQDSPIASPAGPSAFDQPTETAKSGAPHAQGPSAGGLDVEREIKDMKTIMAQQARQITAQGQALSDLMAEINTLKAKLKSI